MTYTQTQHPANIHDKIYSLVPDPDQRYRQIAVEKFDSFWKEAKWNNILRTLKSMRRRHIRYADVKEYLGLNFWESISQYGNSPKDIDDKLTHHYLGHNHNKNAVCNDQVHLVETVLDYDVHGFLHQQKIVKKLLPEFEHFNHLNSRSMEILDVHLRGCLEYYILYPKPHHSSRYWLSTGILAAGAVILWTYLIWNW